MKNTLIELAKQSGMGVVNQYGLYIFKEDELTKFAELLQANSGNAVDEFEKWYVEEVTGCNGEWIAKNENGEYYEKRTQEALKVWLASRGIK